MVNQSFRLVVYYLRKLYIPFMKRSSTGKTQPESSLNPWLNIYHLVGGLQICEPFPGFSEAGRSFRPDGRHLRHPKTFGGWCGYQHLHVSIIYLLMVSSKVWHKADSSFTSLLYGTVNCIQLSFMTLWLFMWNWQKASDVFWNTCHTCPSIWFFSCLNSWPDLWMPSCLLQCAWLEAKFLAAGTTKSLCHLMETIYFAQVYSMGYFR